MSDTREYRMCGAPAMGVITWRNSGFRARACLMHYMAIVKVARDLSIEIALEDLGDNGQCDCQVPDTESGHSAGASD